MTVSATPTRYQPITRCCSASGGQYGLNEWFHLLSLRTSLVKAPRSWSYGTFGGLCVPEPGAAAFVIAEA